MPTVLMAMLLFVLPVAVAQEVSGTADAAKSKAQKLDWPRTFSGQPDFAFTRDEAITESRASAVRVGKVMPSPATLMDLFSDDTHFDPLGLTAVSGTVVDASGTLVAGDDVSGTVQVSLMQRLMAGAMALPLVSDTLGADVSEFRVGLVSSLSSTLARWTPKTDMGAVGQGSFSSVLDTMTLQAIVTSPTKYAVINQQRYFEGDSFLVQVPVDVPDTVVMAALDRRMPPSGTVPDATLVELQKLHDGVLQGFYAARKINPQLGQKVLTVPVVIQRIEPRKVVLNVNGEVHELAVRFTY